MTISEPKHHETHSRAGQPSTLALVRRGALAGAAAAVCTSALAATARTADVSLEVDAAAIPIAAFAFWTLIGTALGVFMARLLRPRRRFLVVTVAATGLSLIPPIALPDDSATKAVLVAAHLLAAAIIVPILSRGIATGAANGGTRNR
ncbi:DUF6069 family protein [Aeromicrobium sp.]|uniref:DUF6069 family protein n=1 Tax=Aeromicrobium sp. TaxID=1871063 RepID=UPI00198A69B4|nr:DUF6069 family protein [Aeromicrobium sp.]MBC7633950.1 hypothetical protein [Aeromicrobium sp.]